MIRTTVKQDLKQLEKTKGRLPGVRTDYVNRKLEEIRQETVFSIGTPYPPASWAGEPPHRRSGRLRGSIKVKKAQVLDTGSRSTSHGYVYAGVHYAKFLERGTRRMAARPFMIRASEKVRARSLLYNQATEFATELWD